MLPRLGHGNAVLHVALVNLVHENIQLAERRHPFGVFHVVKESRQFAFAKAPKGKAMHQAGLVMAGGEVNVLCPFGTIQFQSQNEFQLLGLYADFLDGLGDFLCLLYLNGHDGIVLELLRQPLAFLFHEPGNGIALLG